MRLGIGPKPLDINTGVLVYIQPSKFANKLLNLFPIGAQRFFGFAASSLHIGGVERQPFYKWLNGIRDSKDSLIKAEYSRKLRIIIEVEGAFPKDIEGVEFDTRYNPQDDLGEIQISIDYISKCYIEEID